jgi:Phospholipase_D-nuclease N-terminal
MAKKKWSELSGPQQAVTATVSAVELALTAIALVDLLKRPPEQVRGPKGLWAVGIFIQPAGPIAYLAWGRHGTGAPA